MSLSGSRFYQTQKATEWVVNWLPIYLLWLLHNLLLHSLNKQH